MSLYLFTVPAASQITWMIIAARVIAHYVFFIPKWIEAPCRDERREKETNGRGKQKRESKITEDAESTDRQRRKWKVYSLHKSIQIKRPKATFISTNDQLIKQPMFFGIGDKLQSEMGMGQICGETTD